MLPSFNLTVTAPLPFFIVSTSVNVTSTLSTLFPTVASITFVAPDVNVPTSTFVVPSTVSFTSGLTTTSFLSSVVLLLPPLLLSEVDFFVICV